MVNVGSPIAFVVALIAYIACNRIARRSPHFGGGTVVLSWIGFVVPCLGWIALAQGYSAVSRAQAESPSPATQKNKSSFLIWLAVYIIALAGAGFVARTRIQAPPPVGSYSPAGLVIAAHA